MGSAGASPAVFGALAENRSGFDRSPKRDCSFVIGRLPGAGAPHFFSAQLHRSGSE